MKFINKIIWVFVIGLLVGCDPQEDDKITLGPPPTNVAFSVSAGAEPNTYVFTNTTQGTFIHQWDLGNGKTAEGNEVTAFYQFAGTYIVTLSAFNDGGMAQATATIDVSEDAPTPCLKDDPFFPILTGNGSRAWRLLPEAGAYWVGPHDASTTWWASDANTVTDRPCAFDDEWIFDDDCGMDYDTKGDLWAEDYMGYDFECITDGQLNPGQEAWGSGSFEYSLVSGAGVDGSPQLTITGLGAFIGLPKAANGAEVTQPQIAVTYDVINYAEQANRYWMELQIDMGAGNWRFQLVSPK